MVLFRLKLSIINTPNIKRSLTTFKPQIHQSINDFKMFRQYENNEIEREILVIFYILSATFHENKNHREVNLIVCLIDPFVVTLH